MTSFDVCSSQATATHAPGPVTTPQELVRLQFDGVFGAGAVAAVTVVRDSTRLEALVTSFEAAKLQLEDLLDDYARLLARVCAVPQGTAPAMAASAYLPGGLLKMDTLLCQ